MAPPSPTSAQKLTANDALAYLKAVKEQFQDDRPKYDEFLEVMRDFKSTRIDTAGVIIRVKTLFNGYPELVLGFNTFLPKGYEIKLQDLHTDKKPVDFTEAIGFVNKIKARFQHEEDVYKAFLGVLNMYRMHNKPIQDVYEEVATLFRDHPDLLEEFKHFLPDTSTVPQVLAVPKGGSVKQDGDKAKRSVPSIKRERAHPSTAENDTTVDRPDLKLETGRKRIEKEKGRKTDRDRRDQENDGEYDRKDLDGGQPKRKTFPKKLEAETHQGAASNAALSYNDNDAQKGLYTQEFHFCEKVKEKLQPEAYQEFLKCLHIYSQDIITRSELKILVNDILQRCPDLMNGFSEFLEHCENIDDFLDGLINKRQTSRTVKTWEKERDRGHAGEDMERDNEKPSENGRERLEKVSKDGTTHKATAFSGKEKYVCKPISELDLSNCQRCTPSYRLLPKNYPMPSSSSRTDIGVSVLNDLWVSVTSGSEDYSFKHMRKNQYEESLFRCEDDRFEMDMLLESVKATIKRVEEFIEKLQDNSVEPDSPIHIDEHLTTLNLRCIERLYGDHGVDVIDVLRKNASVALPVILTRLKQKQDEWSRCRSDFNKVWAEVYAKNYHKSLDHRSFYFKQQDSKNLVTKALLSEIKEINEKKRKEDNVLLAIAAGNRRPIVTNMSFEYVDSEIHEDVYQIIKYSCGEVCGSADQVDKVMRTWTTFVEPFLGVQPRARCVEDAGVVKHKSRTPAAGLASVGENNNATANGAVAVKLADRDESIPMEQAQSSRAILANGVAEDAQNGFHDADQTVRRGEGPSGQNISTERSVESTHLSQIEQNDLTTNLEITSGTSTSRGNFSGGEAVTEAMGGNETIPSIGRGETGSRKNSKVEREEGEVSPYGDVEDENFGPPGNVAADGASRPKEASAGRPKAAEFAGENDADVDDGGEGSAQRCTEDSENVSEAGEDASGSESSDDEERSREDHEDADHGDPDVKAESEGEADGNTEAHDADGGISLPFSERLQNAVKPLAKHVPTVLHDRGEKFSRIFYGDDSFYVLFRLHQILYERILSAKTNSCTTEKKWRTSKNANSPHQYSKFMAALYNLLDGSSDNTKFEDDCRSIIGTQSYVLFTLDKLIYKVVKQLQAIASDEMDNKLLQLYIYENSRSPGRFFDLVYHENARVLLHDESNYRFERHSNPTRLSIQLMEYGHEKPEATAVSIDPKFSSYLYDDYLSSISHTKLSDDVFLERNKRKHGSSDDPQASLEVMDDFRVTNGLENKISCKSSKASYVLDTEDVLFRVRRRRVSSSRTTPEKAGIVKEADALKAQRFHKFLSRP
ncbi:hypothetical protein QYE76_030086 [Lolium multiflorum]|uniref:Histone deacetylase interacting domain-containing protein n=1 Tax=Lolium multiflorum TaxID=4521 RepID=A0AAD8QP45_LOLMU|nr:hypothetical protein QYE76_030086 [Lolium multiflorum]